MITYGTNCGSPCLRQENPKEFPRFCEISSFFFKNLPELPDISPNRYVGGLASPVD
jgi:hypothetical protein